MITVLVVILLLFCFCAIASITTLVSIDDDTLQCYLKRAGELNVLLQVQTALRIPRSFVQKLLGPDGSLKYCLNVTALYYVLLPTICLLFPPAGVDEHILVNMLQNSWIAAMLLNVWIGSNVLGDCISFFFARKYINRICDDASLTWRKLIISGISVLAITTACCTSVIIVSNACNAWQVASVSNWSDALIHYGFDFSVVMRPFAMRLGGHEYASFPGGMLIIASITYLPAAIFAMIVIIMCCVLFPMLKFVSFVSEGMHRRLVSHNMTRGELMAFTSTFYSITIGLIWVLIKVLLK